MPTPGQPKWMWGPSVHFEGELTNSDYNVSGDSDSNEGGRANLERSEASQLSRLATQSFFRGFTHELRILQKMPVDFEDHRRVCVTGERGHDDGVYLAFRQPVMNVRVSHRVGEWLESEFVLHPLEPTVDRGLRPRFPTEIAKHRSVGIQLRPFFYDLICLIDQVHDAGLFLSLGFFGNEDRDFVRMVDMASLQDTSFVRPDARPPERTAKSP